MNNPTRKKAVIVCTWDWYYHSHRRTIARMLQSAGYEVVLVTRVFELRDEIEADGVRIIELPFSRPSLNPLKEYQLTRRLKKIYRQEQPDLVFHIAFKPVLYGSLAASSLDIPLQVNAIAGMGQLFLGKSLKIRMIRRLVMFLLRRGFRSSRTRLIVQNRRDLAFLKETLQMPDERLALIKGVGVDLDQFHPVDKPDRPPVISMVARLIREKGVEELVEATRILKAKGLDFKVRLVGDPDFDSPEQITRQQLTRWQEEGLVHWTGFRKDIQQVNAETDIAVLPSYSEGLPKSLMEAASCGLPIVTTDNSGCSEVVENGVNGWKVPVRNSVELANALARLIEDGEMRDSFGRASRRKAEAEFELGEILRQTAEVCDLGSLKAQSQG